VSVAFLLLLCWAQCCKLYTVVIGWLS